MQGPRAILLLLLLVVLLLAPVVTSTGAAPVSSVEEDRWGPMSTPVPHAAIELFETAVVGYASLRGEVVAPLEQVRAWIVR